MALGFISAEQVEEPGQFPVRHRDFRRDCAASDTAQWQGRFHARHATPQRTRSPARLPPMQASAFRCRVHVGANAIECLRPATITLSSDLEIDAVSPSGQVFRNYDGALAT